MECAAEARTGTDATNTPGEPTAARDEALDTVPQQ